ncbi:hypothetical protein C8J56DRAFT_910352 [Mycena floridula]|nr:hypothetical protein C8J56DRAFT_910352 [Mycena floridula]
MPVEVDWEHLKGLDPEFFHRNDFFVILSRSLFGFRSGDHVTFGTMCSAFATVYGARRVGTEIYFMPDGLADLTQSVPFNVKDRRPLAEFAKIYRVWIRRGASSQLARSTDIFLNAQVLRSCIPSKTNTPLKEISRTPEISRPRSPSVPAKAKSSSKPPSRPGTPDPSIRRAVSPSAARDARAERNTSGCSPSPSQNRARAPDAPDRCWNMYRRCAVSGKLALDGALTRPADINMAHLYQFHYQDQWVADGLSRSCKDPGPEDMSEAHRYLGYHKICCLNNMVPLEHSIHDLHNDFRLAFDRHDDNRLVVFTKERAELAALKLNVDQIPEQFQPSPDILQSQLAQCVVRRCLLVFKDSSSSTPASLESVLEEIAARDEENMMRMRSISVGFSKRSRFQSASGQVLPQDPKMGAGKELESLFSALLSYSEKHS